MLIKPLSDNNKATPLLNFPTTNTGMGRVTTTGNEMGNSGSGIFPSNCGSPSIMMGNGSNNSSGGPLGMTTSSILSPTNVSAASSSSPSSSASSSAKKSFTAAGSAKASVGGDYDYHATQLEMFLDEYKRLQQQLCKMKETCDSIRKSEEVYGVAGSNAGGAGRRSSGSSHKPVMPASISSALATDLGSDSMGHQYYPMNGKLLEKSNVLLPSSQEKMGTAMTLPKRLSVGNKHKSYSGTTPEPPPYWLHRNELLKGIQSQQQQQATKSEEAQIFSTSLGSGGTDPSNHNQSQSQTDWRSKGMSSSFNGRSSAGGS